MYVYKAEVKEGFLDDGCILAGTTNYLALHHTLKYLTDDGFLLKFEWNALLVIEG